MELDPQLFHVEHVVVEEFQEFEGCEKCVHDLKLLFLNTLFEWKNASGLFFFAILPEMLGSLLLVLNVGVTVVHILCT